MTDKSKIKIVDNTVLRSEIARATKRVTHVHLATWALSVAKRVLCYVEKEFPHSDQLQNGIQVGELWQRGEASVQEVRQAGFNVHELARRCESETAKAAARAIGHAVSVGHMRGHAVVCSDYAIKAVGLDSKADMNKITEERQWQLNELEQYRD
ncbi:MULTISPECIES: putative immunity protein [Planococcus]|uniref:Imm-5-like domain-containing protein n=2 Tax=Planococcus TaxID=1372 RepID=A0ABN4JZ77_9BACL|nr:MULTISPECIES: hypothetical protein [Planococcus]ALS78691.1 hypothetical protein AUO94_08465 [Planococcus kocurii]AQU79351.1 hypothetical protein AJGP001_08765 [Planococcus faecalis]KAA0955132.1 hypothetical protein FQ085_15745 [Planococcus sp. ANT_H30]MDJ0333107.1 hypothetical protein [Planococcus sp. S3-L1]OHX51201.1 hypothetical protein BB777_17865 [Planococcus faecalis]